jgi:hypothetical protein
MWHGEKMLTGRDGGALVAIATIVDEEFDAVREAGEFIDLAGETAFLFGAAWTTVAMPSSWERAPIVATLVATNLWVNSSSASAPNT